MRVDARQILQEIEQSWVACQEYAQKLRRCKFTLRGDVPFNYPFYVDVFLTKGKPVSHVVDQTTWYKDAKWLATQTLDDKTKLESEAYSYSL